MDDYYRIVGVERTASMAEIDRTSREQLRQWQPRTYVADLARRQEAERRMMLLGVARSVLLDPAKRASYDRQFGQPPSVAVSSAPQAEPPPALRTRLRRRWYLVAGGAAGLACWVAAAGPEAALPSLAFLVVAAFVVSTPMVSTTRFRSRDPDR